MIYSISGNPYVDESTNILTNGVSTSAKAAKLNQEIKRPAVHNNWKKALSELQASLTPTIEISSDVLARIGMTMVNFPKEGTRVGAKKLRTDPKAVNDKCRMIYLENPKEDIPTPAPVVEITTIDEKDDKTLTPNVIGSRVDVHGRHERTGEIPVNEIKEAIETDLPPINSVASFVSRTERNSNDVRIDTKQDTKAGDMDLYNKLVHNGGQEDDVVRQLQGARSQLSAAKDENKKLAEELSEAEKLLETLEKENRELIQRQQAQTRAALTKTLRDYDAVQEDNLAKTNNLTSIRAQIERLKAEKEAREASMYDSFAA